MKAGIVDSASLHSKTRKRLQSRPYRAQAAAASPATWYKRVLASVEHLAVKRGMLACQQESESRSDRLSELRKQIQQGTYYISNSELIRSLTTGQVYFLQHDAE